MVKNMESSKNETKVVIGGKVYTLSGYEGEEYIQKVASYLNGKIDELQSEEGYNHLSSDLRSLLLQINIADDYFKSKHRSEVLDEDIKSKEKDLYDIKHELVTTQMKLEAMDKSLKKAQNENDENARKIIRLESGSKS